VNMVVGAAEHDVLRPLRIKRFFSPENEPAKNLWFYEDTDAMSRIIGTAASPITALSAKLISMNRNRIRAITQAYFDGRCALICLLPLREC